MFNSSKIIKNNRLNRLYQNMLISPAASSQAWELKFTNELLWDGRKVKLMAITDSYDQSVLGIEAVDHLLSLEDQLLGCLSRLQTSGRVPNRLVYEHCCFMSIALDKWCRQHGIKQVYLHSGFPSKNDYLSRLVRKKNTQTTLIYSRSRF